MVVNDDLLRAVGKIRRESAVSEKSKNELSLVGEFDGQ